MKYYLFQKLADFPQIHRISALLEDLGEAYDKQERVKNFLEEKNGLIRDLEEAYIHSRYIPVEFDQKKVEQLGKLAEEIINLVKNL